MSVQDYCTGLTIRSLDQGAVMRGSASVRYLAAAAGAACVVSLASAAPGWAQTGAFPALSRASGPGSDPITFPNAAYAIAGASQGLYFSTNSGLGIFNTHSRSTAPISA
jgi:hypothetical protein